MLKFRLIFLNTSICIFTLTISQCVKGQTEIPLTSETIKPYSPIANKNQEHSSFYLIGKMDKSPVYLLKGSEEGKLFVLNEEDMKFSDFETFKIKSGIFLSDFLLQDSILFFLKSNTETIDQENTADMNVKVKNHTYFLQKLKNADKPIKVSFSNDNTILSISTLTAHSDYYDPLEDDSISFYNLNLIKNKQITSKKVFCKYCSNAQVANGKIFFNKAIPTDDYSNAYGITDIFVASNTDLNDSEKIAAHSEVLKVSSDGRLLLIRRLYDLPNTPMAILNIKDRRYALLLGRDYNSATPFYSDTKKCFAFDFKGNIVYVKTPETFPFDALLSENPLLQDSALKDRLKNLKHPPLKR